MSQAKIAEEIDLVSNKIRYLKYINKHCSNLMKNSKISENEFFDRKIFSDSQIIMQQYYKIDDELLLLFEGNKKKAGAKMWRSIYTYDKMSLILMWLGQQIINI